MSYDYFPQTGIILLLFLKVRNIKHKEVFNMKLYKQDCDINKCNKHGEYTLRKSQLNIMRLCKEHFFEYVKVKQLDKHGKINKYVALKIPQKSN